AFALEARKFNLALLKPGAPCKDVFEEYNAFMRKNGRPEERRPTLPWPGLRSGGAAAHSAGRANEHRKTHEYRGPSDLYPWPRAVLGLRHLSDRTKRPRRTPAPVPRSDHGIGLSRASWNRRPAAARLR